MTSCHVTKIMSLFIVQEKEKQNKIENQIKENKENKNKIKIRY